jgi:hypothetical protein
MSSQFRFVARFAKTLRRDLEAVTLSITGPWNNGPVEGHIKVLDWLLAPGAILPTMIWGGAQEFPLPLIVLFLVLPQSRCSSDVPALPQRFNVNQMRDLTSGEP